MRFRFFLTCRFESKGDKPNFATFGQISSKSNEAFSSFNGPCVTSGPNGPEPNDNRLLQENGYPWELCFFKVLLKFCAEFNRKKTHLKDAFFVKINKYYNTVNIGFVLLRKQCILYGNLNSKWNCLTMELVSAKAESTSTF